ncbi:hypothetical protein GIB67_028817 [Kingdonia uniflora]|uniref:Uncharacterized protein n=1 Tax=Kingdonia uniflora TaxID=39325 RepID=A0A7J7LTG3_9MAGN|nr:hypothetical protein GIB67_028817 [Kingdonia uniflora]
MWHFHYMVLFAAHRRSCLRMLTEDAVVVEDEKAGVSSVRYCRYPVKDWMRSKYLKPSSKFVVSTSSEESSSSNRTMDDSEVIGTVPADNPAASSGRDAGLHAGNETGQFWLWFRTLVRPGGNIEHYQVVGDGFLCYLNQAVYGLSIPLTFFQKGVMNALKSCSGQLNGNVFEMMRFCEALNQKWIDGGIARQFVADDILKYYKFKYVKDRKSGYLFSDSARPKFFDFESSGRPWCNHLMMVRGNCMQVPGEPVLELMYKNFNEKPNPKVVADTSSLFDVISREGNKLNKILGELGIRREKRLKFVVEKVHPLIRQPRVKKTVPPSEQIPPLQILPVGSKGVDADANMVLPLKKQKKESGKDIRASSKGVNLEAVEQEALDLVKRDPIRLDTQIRSSISQLSVAWKSVAEFKKEKDLQRETFEKEKALQKDQFEKEATATKKEVEDEAKKAVDTVVASQNKLIQAFYFWGLSREDVDLALAGKYSEIIFPGDDAFPVTEQSLSPPVVDDKTEEAAGLQCRYGKIKIERDKVLQKEGDRFALLQKSLKDKRFVDESDKLECQRSILSLTLYFEAEVDSEWGMKEAYLELLTEGGIVPDPAHVKFLAQEARNRHSIEAQRCSARAGVSIIWGGVDPLPDELDFCRGKER